MDIFILLFLLLLGCFCFLVYWLLTIEREIAYFETQIKFLRETIYKYYKKEIDNEKNQ